MWLGARWRYVISLLRLAGADEAAGRRGAGTLDDQGEPVSASCLAMEGETVSPRQFHNRDIKPSAFGVADLVPWIGYLK